MAIALFICILITFLLVLVPRDEYDVSPGNAAIEKVKSSFGARLTTDSKKNILGILNRSIKDIVKTGLLVGIGLGFIVTLLTFKFIGPFAVVAGLLTVLSGFILAEKLVESEYKKWQERLFEGIPTLVNFTPAFLEIESITPREALNYTLPFLPEPLRSEMWSAIDRIRRTGKVRDAMNVLSQRANHPLVDAISFRISATWDAKVTSDIFGDLSDQVDDMTEMAATRATTAKTGYMALVCVFGLVGMVLIYGYPGMSYLMNKMTGGFGF